MQTDKQQRLLRAALSLLILAPYLLATIIATDLGTVPMRLLYLLCGTMWFLLPALLLRPRAFFTFHSITLLTGLVETVHLVLYHATTSLLFVNTIFIAEPGEFLELCSTGWPIALLALMLFGGYFWFIFNKIDNQTPLFSHSGRRILGCAELLMGIMLFGAISSDGIARHHLVFPIHNERHEGVVTRVQPLNMLHHAIDIVQLHRQIDATAQQLENFTFGIKPTATPQGETIVLVIGETARYGNFGINGYPRNTTPLLQQRTNLISFDSVYAVANLTTVSVPLMLSPATPQTAADYIHQKSLPEAFAEAHYTTAWIADQSFGNQFLMRISGNCDYTHYIPSGDECYDINLLHYLQPLLDTAQQSQFVVLHSLGCHYKYNCRYPADSAAFLPDLNTRPDIEALTMNLREATINRDKNVLIDEVRNILVNSYDNAIRYTDFFLDSTINMLQKSERPCLLLYIGDHGENLLDDDRHMLLHGTYSGSAYEFHVPMIVWYSDSYARKYPSEIKNLQQNKRSKTSSMTLFATMLQLSHVPYPKLNATQSLASPTFAPDSIVYGLDANLQVVEIPLE